MARRVRRWVTAWITVSTGTMAVAEQTTASSPRKIGSEPQLFLDDYVVDRMEGLKRKVHHPTRLPEPILDSRRFKTFQPYLSVLYDDRMTRYRIWYNGHDGTPGLYHAESKDGIHWENPRKLDLSVTYSCSVVDDGPRETHPERRYKLIYWHQSGPRPRGIYVAFSSDGLAWTAHPENPVLEAYGEDAAHTQRHHVGDIVDAYYDPIRKCYGAALKLPAVPEDRYPPGPKAGHIFRRLVGMSESRDFVRWSKPWRIFVPDEKDEGLLEFYGMGGIHLRGSLYIGFVRALRDDLPCDEGGPKDGIGYTVLATSRDGVTWNRYREAFFDRNPAKGSWDHAMTWVSAVLPMGDEVYLYYGGYARGHKIEATRERQLGLAKLRKDGYVSLSAGDGGGRLLTPPLVFAGARLRLNVDVATGGEVRVGVLAVDGKDAPGFSISDCERLVGRGTAQTVSWKSGSDVSVLAGKPVRLRFELRSADLYAFQFQASEQ